MPRPPPHFFWGGAGDWIKDLTNAMQPPYHWATPSDSGFWFCHIYPRFIAEEESDSEIPVDINKKSQLCLAGGPGKGWPHQKKTFTH
jgi:hypothetical protein